ncbi:choline dehydrogenase [Ferruginivarius sediminum]|uniref:Choline dehydrogenase n=1 Tax=Ferruginivarius sediminum TaxID=2661937 RepID=A0A369TBV4_9PROT|nr:choline dehydrogenase [Ferruginivarius sediminum]RDD62758.1 choline dehydrogenase [Ferruginivarius sediminum]
MSEREVFDYVIVGAGSAGGVLAHRLSEDPDVSVLLLEAGPPDWSLFIHMPAAFAEPLKGTRFNWAFETEPEPYMDNRRMYCPRGRTLGGSSSINGMAYIRGHGRDYDRWARTNGMERWAYRHCLPYFKKAETHELGPDDYHGGDGPLHVTRGKCENPLFKAFIQAGQEAGYPYTPDMNGYKNEGFGPMDRTTRDGLRWSTANAYLRPASKRPNLTIRTRALTTRVAFEGTKATGVDYVRKGRETRVLAEREVILCAGAIQSPQLLQMSGVGPADLVQKLGVPVVADLPGVGENLQDHIEVYVQHKAKRPVSLYSATRYPRKAFVGLQWLLFRSGPGASSQFEAGGFIRSEAGVEHPNLQYHFLPVAVSYDGSEAAPYHGYQAHVGPMRPDARGHVRARSTDPRVPPEILFNYNMSERDRREMRDAVKLTREVMAQHAFDDLRGEEIAPGPDCKTDADIEAFVRRKSESAYHPSCTCAMGFDGMAVVDDTGRVHGVDKLRVVDASIMPTIVSGNLNAPTIMLAEKIADAIHGNEPLPPDDAPVWIHPEWQTQQR